LRFLQTLVDISDNPARQQLLFIPKYSCP